MRRFSDCLFFLMVLVFGVGVSGAAPAERDDLAIGLFVPTRGPQAEDGAEVIRGAELALEQANREGGVEGRPLRLITASADQKWESASRELVDLIYTKNVRGIVGGLEARSAHLAAQIITRARGKAVFLTPWTSELTFSQVPIPWLFRVVSDDQRQATVMVEEIFHKRNLGRVALWVGSDFNDIAAAETFVRRSPVTGVTKFLSEGVGSGRELAQRLQSGEFEALVIFGRPVEAARFVRRLPTETLARLTLYAPMSLAVPSFLSQIGDASDCLALVIPALDENAPRTLRFIQDYQEKYETAPGLLAAHTYDSLTMLVAALREWEPEKEGELSSVLATTTIEGATGTVRFDKDRARDGLPKLTRFGDGVLELFSTTPRERTE